MTFAFGAGPDHMAGTFHFGMGSFGVRGDLVPTDGENGPSPLYGCVVLPGDAAKEFRLKVTRLPSVGTLRLREDGTADYNAPVPTTDSFDGQLEVDGIDFGSPITFPLTIGSGVIVGGNATEDSDQAGGGATVVPIVTVGGNATDDVDMAAGGASGPGAITGGNATDGSAGASGGATGSSPLTVNTKRIVRGTVSRRLVQ